MHNVSKKKLLIIPLTFFLFVLGHIAAFGMPEGSAESHDPYVFNDNTTSGETCPVDMMIIIVKDLVT